MTGTDDITNESIVTDPVDEQTISDSMEFDNDQRVEENMVTLMQILDAKERTPDDQMFHDVVVEFLKVPPNHITCEKLPRASFFLIQAMLVSKGLAERSEVEISEQIGGVIKHMHAIKNYLVTSGLKADDPKIRETIESKCSFYYTLADVFTELEMNRTKKIVTSIESTTVQTATGIISLKRNITQRF